MKSYLHPLGQAVCLLGLLLVGATSTEGAILAKDSYIVGPGDYAAGTTLSGQSSASATGFTGVWQNGSANLQAEAGGILDGDVNLIPPSNGQGRFLPVADMFPSFRTNNYGLAPIGSVPPNNTFYTSHLVNAGTSGGLTDQFAFVGFGSSVSSTAFAGTAGNLLGAFTGFVIRANGTVDLVVRSRTSTTTPFTSDAILASNVAGTTFNVVMALEYDNPGDTVRYWLNPTDFSNGEAGLTASTTVNGSIAGFQLSGLSDMNRFSVSTTFTSRSFFWDESILATTVADLNPNPVPEPSSYALLACAVGALAFFRRK